MGKIVVYRVSFSYQGQDYYQILNRIEEVDTLIFLLRNAEGIENLKLDNLYD
jgi:hypothetical protein